MMGDLADEQFSCFVQKRFISLYPKINKIKRKLETKNQLNLIL